MQTTEAPTTAGRAAEPFSGTVLALTGGLSLAVAAGVAAYSTFRGGGGKLTDYLILLAIVVTVTAITFGVLAPWALRPAGGNRPAVAAMVLSILAIPAMLVFFTGIGVILAAGAILLGVAGRRRALEGAAGAGTATAGLAIALLALAGQVAAAVTDAPGPAAKTQTARIVAGDAWRLTGFDGLREGWVTLTFQALEGPQDHGLGISRLLGDVTFEEAFEAFTGDDSEAFLAMAEPAGGFVGVRGPATHRVTLRLRPGTYAMFDFGGGPEGPNFMKGMTASFEVAAAEEPVGSPPQADGEIVLTEYAVEMSEPAAGPGTYLVRNAGRLLHELNIAEAAPGTDVAEEVRRHAESGRGDFEPLVGVSHLAAGAQVYVELDLEAGPHLFACFLQLPGGPPHAAEGMWTEVTVG